MLHLHGKCSTARGARAAGPGLALLGACLLACAPAAKPPGEGPADAGAPAALESQQPPPAAPKKVALPPPGMLYHGVLPQGTTEPDSDVNQANLDGYEAAVGRRVAYVYFSNDWFRSRAFPVHTASWVRDRGSVPFIRLMMRSQARPNVVDPNFTLDRILAGEFDPDLEAWADGAKAFGTPLVVEYGTEVNGDWNPWSAPYNGGWDVGPEKFRRTYRHVVELMRARGVDNITWAIHYNSQNYPGGDPRNTPAAYYPGDDVVDWVGISAYGSERPTDHRCNSFRSLVDDMMPQLLAATAHKPIFIFEFGHTPNNPNCVAGPWVQAAFDDLLGGRWPELRGFSWWNEHWENDHPPTDDTLMKVQEVPEYTAVFHQELTGPHAGEIQDRPLFQ